MTTTTSVPEHGRHDHDAHPHDDTVERPCCCNNGWVTIGLTVVDPETGEETLEEALYLCRRCADSR